MGALRCTRSTLLLLLSSTPLVGFLGSALVLGRAQSTNGSEITVRAGAHDRRDAIVSFTGSGIKPGIYDLQPQPSGAVVPLQVDADGRAWFVLPELAAGGERRFRIGATTRSSPAGIRAERSGDSVRIAWDKLPLLDYVGGEGVLPDGVKPIFRRGGYLHPVRTPSGRIVTDDYPSDHYHHHGIWFAWTKTEFQGRHPDFWNMGDSTGRVDFTALDDTWSGPVHAGLRARHHYTDVSAPTPTIALREVWHTRAFAVGRGAHPYFLFDVEVSQTTATNDPLILDEYRYGGIGVRGPTESRSLDNAFFLTSEGKDRKEGDTSRGRWCHIGSRVNGQLAGLAILGHPENFRAPEPMRVNPTDPFFCYAPPQLGRFEIRPGTPHVAKYRFIVADGGPDAKEIDRIWRDYAEPPQVIVK